MFKNPKKSKNSTGTCPIALRPIYIIKEKLGCGIQQFHTVASSDFLSLHYRFLLLQTKQRLSPSSTSTCPLFITPPNRNTVHPHFPFTPAEEETVIVLNPKEKKKKKKRGFGSNLMMEEYTDPPSVLISSFDGDFSESAAEIIHAVSLKEEIHDSIAEEEEMVVIGDEAEEEEEEEEVEENDEEETVIEDEAEEEEEEVEEDDEEEEEFSFVLVGSDSAPITADDAFQNGQIRSFFPIFDQSLLYGGVSTPDREDLPHLLPVNKVFIETEESISPAAAGNGKNKVEISGPYCTWTRKAVEATVSASPEVCKKSNSTGFSKLWRFHDLLHRSNSDGKDAYVFLNGSRTSRSKAASEKRQSAVSSAAAVAGEKIKPKAKKGVKSAALKAHEQYLRSKEEDRRRSYLPYRPELMGFFTNIHGGMTKNVHPF